MKTVPMIFNTDMVKALLSGNKTVTRRPINSQPSADEHSIMYIVSSTESRESKKLKWFDGESTYGASIKKPCEIGDLIWVRETFAALGHDDYNQVNPNHVASVHEYRYKASESPNLANCSDHEVRGYKWVPSIHMPKQASRLTLKVVDVRIEKLKKLNHDEAIKEGFNDWTGFAFTWSQIYLSKGLGWDTNPSVWVIEFEVIHKNVAQVINQKAAVA